MFGTLGAFWLGFTGLVGVTFAQLILFTTVIVWVMASPPLNIHNPGILMLPIILFFIGAVGHQLGELNLVSIVRPMQWYPGLDLSQNLSANIVPLMIFFASVGLVAFVLTYRYFTED